MGTYQYKARDKFGKPIVGLMGGDSENMVASKLKNMGYIPVSIKEAEISTGFTRFLDRFRKVKPFDLNMFTRQFAALQKAGVPILLSLQALWEEVGNKNLKDIIGQVIRDIEAGSSLSSALKKHHSSINPLYVNMIETGEASGTLDKALERLAELGEYEERVQQRIKAATRYPMIVVIAIIIGFLILTTLVVPRFARIYNQFSASLPLPTKILLWLNYAVTTYWWISIIVLSIFIFSFNKFINTEKGRIWWDTFKLKVPIFGFLTQRLVMSRFTRITGALLKSGVPLFKVLDLVSGGVGNVVISRTIENIKTSVSEGKGLSEPMRSSGIFSPIVVQMVSIGEQTGKVDDLLLHASEYYDSQVEFTIENFTSLIEPILTLILGCAVLLMALGIFLPMWNLINIFKK